MLTISCPSIKFIFRKIECEPPFRCEPRLSYSKVSILSLESKHIISSNNNCADFNNLIIIIIVFVGYLLRVGFEPTYSPL